VDALSDVLSKSRVKGAVFCRAELAAPWGVLTKGAEKAIFHVIVRGAGCAIVGDQTVWWRAGDLVVLPHGHAHVLADSADTEPVWIGGLPSEPGADGLPCLTHGGQGAATSILCGSFELASEARELLLPALPPLLHVRGGEGPASAWLDATLRLLASEAGGAAPGAAAVVSHLADVLFVHVLRAWMERETETSRGWLGALSDAQVARALGAIHRAPAQGWSVDDLAREAGMSRSALYTRFTDRVGEPPAAYLTRWRMHLARQALREGHGLATVASEVGYGSEAAFSRAFKRQVGVSPARWRSAARHAP
jgi:AraC-like DNA-binding protein